MDQYREQFVSVGDEGSGWNTDFFRNVAQKKDLGLHAHGAIDKELAFSVWHSGGLDA